MWAGAFELLFSVGSHKEKAWFSWNQAFSVLLVESVAFEGEGDALAATDAQGRQAFLGIALDHFMQQGHQHAAA
jgi:hypothetical protein